MQQVHLFFLFSADNSKESCTFAGSNIEPAYMLLLLIYRIDSR